MTIEYVKLNPQTLELDDVNGIDYMKTITESGSVIIEIVPPPPPPPSLDEAKSAKLAELETAFENSLLNGFTSMADGTSRIYPIDPVSMAKLTSASTVINGGKVASIVIKDFNGNRVTLTSAQYQQMAADGFAFYNTQEQHLWDQQDKTKAATTVDAVNTIAW